MKTRIYLASPHMGSNELNFIHEAFKENWIAPLGPNVNGFESDLQNYTGVPHAAALSSGTAAIHLALILAGVNKDDSVICQSFTFCGSSNPIIYQGAQPVFIDSELDTWNMDPDMLELAIKELDQKGKRPKAIIYVHLYGMPAKVNEIRSIAHKYEIALIEDAAEALGSSYQEKKCGNFGDLSVLSFNGNKIITTSGAGALLSNNESMVKKARFLATQARDEAHYYLHSEIGYNYRISNISAGIGRGQMQVLDQRVKRKREIFDLYKAWFMNKEGFWFSEEVDGSHSNRWLSTLIIEEKNELNISPEKLRLAFEKENIESRPLWNPMHLQPVFKGAKTYENGTSQALFEKGICLPSGTNMTDDDLTRIFDVLEGLCGVY